MRLAVKRGGAENGFALLLVFLMAAAVAFTFYAQLPRVAFESAREREQLLMDRGNEYKRAIQVFYAVNKRYPAKLEDLENTNEKRYLRRRYQDPMTGKDEWRLVHTDGSMLTDSLVEKPPAQNGQNALPGGGPLGSNNMNTANANATNQAAGADPNNPAGTGPVAVNAAVAARPSDRVFTPDQVQVRGGIPNGGGFPGSNGQPPGNPLAGLQSNLPGNYDPGDPRTWPAITTLTTPPNGQVGPNGQPVVNGQLVNGQLVNGQAGQLNPAFANPNQPQINTPGIPGQTAGVGGLNPQPLNFGPGAAGFQQQPGQPQFNQPQFNQPQFNQPQTNQPQMNQPQPGANQAGPPQNAVSFPSVDNSNAAIGLINNQLTQGAPSGVAGNGASNGTANTIAPFSAGPGIGSTTAPANAAPTNTGVPGGGPGIAGVASKHEGPSIKSYHERTKYQEWEFVYKPSLGATVGAIGPTNPGQTGLGQTGSPQTGSTQPSQPGASQPNSIGPTNNLFGPSTPGQQ